MLSINQYCSFTGHLCLEQADILQALMRAEVSVLLNFGIPAAVQWAENFLFPLRSLLFEFHKEPVPPNPEGSDRVHHHRSSVIVI